MEDNVRQETSTPNLKVGPLSNITDSTITIAGRDVVIQYTRDEFVETQTALQVAIERLQKEQLRLLRDSSRPPDRPFRHLYPFDLMQRTVFYGRDAARDALLTQIGQNRLTLLHAPSGAGKTSLLRAGLQAALIEADHVPVHLPRPSRPVQAIRQMLLPRPPYPDRFDRWPLNTLLAWACHHLGNPRAWLVVIIDQFEEFFIQASPDNQQEFVRSLADCLLNISELEQVRFVLTMRKDYFSDMDMFKAEIPQIFQNAYRLPALGEAEARQAIEDPLGGRPIRWADGAVDELLAYLKRGEIETPHLQLICSRLYDQALASGEAVIRVGGLDLQAIHANYLEEEMAALAPPEFTPAQRELGWKLLKRLVTSHGTRQALALPALTDGLPLAEVEPVLARLLDRRLLRSDDDPSTGEATMEIAHDTLAALILEKYPEERRRKTAWELISRGLEDWTYHKTLMDPARLHILDKYQDVLEQFFSDPEITSIRKQVALEYLLRSAVAAGQRIVEWFKLASRGRLDVNELVQEWTSSAKRKDRAAAALILGEMSEAAMPQLTALLSDDYPQVRLAAIAALEKLQPGGEWRKYLKYECYVPAGEFEMGGGYSDQDNASPIHKVYLDAYYIGKYPVTNADYKHYTDEIGRPFSISDGKAQYPVVNVNWYQANEYAVWAGMRLLTEAEWEKAASWDPAPFYFIYPSGEEKRGIGLKRLYPWGDRFDPNRCNISESSISPVGKYSPQGDSPYGCADMVGNVLEWTSSLKAVYPYRVDDGREDSTSMDSRVQRGGSFTEAASVACCAFRQSNYPGNASDYGGFRCGTGVKELVSPPKE